MKKIQLPKICLILIFRVKVLMHFSRLNLSKASEANCQLCLLAKHHIFVLLKKKQFQCQFKLNNVE